jgi:hypothetical protein
MCPEEYEATIEASIRSNRVASYPTACALAIQGTVAAADPVAVQLYAGRRSQSRRQRIITRGPVILDLQGPNWIGRVTQSNGRG